MAIMIIGLFVAGNRRSDNSPIESENGILCNTRGSVNTLSFRRKNADSKTICTVIEEEHGPPKISLYVQNMISLKLIFRPSPIRSRYRCKS